jgi:hypothetical protein
LSTKRKSLALNWWHPVSTARCHQSLTCWLGGHLVLRLQQQRQSEMRWLQQVWLALLAGEAFASGAGPRASPHRWH